MKKQNYSKEFKKGLEEGIDHALKRFCDAFMAIDDATFEALSESKKRKE